MQFVLDFGNSYQKCALFKQSEMIAFERFEKATLTQLQEFLNPYPEVKSCIISSVIHTEANILEWLKTFPMHIELTSETIIPIINKYSTPETLGKDRLAVAVGAASLAPHQNVLTVDIGTAIKFDLVNSHGEYLGGSISPGLYLRFKALHNFTAKLPLVEYNHVHNLIGTNTETSILSGVMNGAIAEVNGLIAQYRSQFKDLQIFLTGGESIYFDKYIKNNIFAVANLVLIGLNEILIFNERTHSL
jgi:type III pantothenate kinase